MSTRSEAAGERLFQSYWQDGSIDLFAGGAVTAIGIGWLIDQVALASVVPALTVPLWMVFRHRVVEPRLGYVKFDQARRERVRRGQLVLLAIGTVALVVAVVAWFALRSSDGGAEWARRLAPGLPATLVGVGGALSALMFRMPRLGAYGLCCAVFGVAGAMLGLEPGWPILAGGVVTAAAGAWLLGRFLREFPRLSNEID